MGVNKQVKTYTHVRNMSVLGCSVKPSLFLNKDFYQYEELENIPEVCLGNHLSKSTLLNRGDVMLINTLQECDSQ